MAKLIQTMAHSFDVTHDPHRRRNALNGDWVLVSPHRGKRPWLGQTEAEATLESKPYEADCYLCPGNQRMGGDVNPDYDATFVFTNDFAALKSDVPEATLTDEFFTAKTERGLSKVMCFSPDHSMTLAEMSACQVERVLDGWIEQLNLIGPSHPWIQIFENKGAANAAAAPVLAPK